VSNELRASALGRFHAFTVVESRDSRKNFFERLADILRERAVPKTIFEPRLPIDRPLPGRAA
jgi:hypothetical protein